MRKKMIIPAVVITLLLFPSGYLYPAKRGIQNKDYPVTMEGIGELKLQMTKAEIEKLVQGRISLKHIGSGGYGDTVAVQYQGMEMILFLDESDSASVAVLTAIQTSHPSCKTANGLGPGSTRMAVIDGFAQNTRYVAPAYSEYPTRSRTRSLVAVLDTTGSSAIVFHLQDKKVTSVEVRSYYEFY